jgi:DNA-binding transcriptional ArsR family regulator
MSAITDLFPRARAEILRLLFSGGSMEIHLRDLARLAGMSPAALQKELTHLTNKEFVLMRRDGNRAYYRANAAHPLFTDLCGIALKTTGIATELSKSLSNVDGIDYWILKNIDLDRSDIAVVEYNPLFGDITINKFSLELFIEKQEELLKIIDLAADVDLKRVRIPISISKIIRLRLGDALLFVCYHNQRHMQQILNLINHPEFPKK